MNNRECFIESKQIEEKPVHNNAAEFNDYVEVIDNNESIEDQKQSCIELGKSVIDDLISKNELLIEQIEEIHNYGQKSDTDSIRNKISEWRWTVHDETEPLAEAFYYIEKKTNNIDDEAEQTKENNGFNIIQKFVEEVNQFDSSEIDMTGDNVEKLQSQTIKSFKKAMAIMTNAKAELTRSESPNKSKTYQELEAAFK